MLSLWKAQSEKTIFDMKVVGNPAYAVFSVSVILQSTK